MHKNLQTESVERLFEIQDLFLDFIKFLSEDINDDEKFLQYNLANKQRPFVVVIFLMLRDGYNRLEIAEKLGISYGAVRVITYRVFQVMQQYHMMRKDTYLIYN